MSIYFRLYIIMNNYQEKEQKAIQQLKKLFSKFDFELVWKVIKLEDKYSLTLDELKYDLASRMICGIEPAIKWAPSMWMVWWIDYSLYLNSCGEIDMDLSYVVCKEKSRWIWERIAREPLEDRINYVLWN